MPRVKIQRNLKSKAFVDIFQQKLLKNGKKKLASRIIQKSLDIIAEKTNKNAFPILEKAVRNSTPSVQIQTRKKGSNSRIIPVLLDIDRGILQAVRWIIASAKKRSERNFNLKLSYEILDAAKKAGGAYKKKEEIHKIAQKNPQINRKKKKKKKKRVIRKS